MPGTTRGFFGRARAPRDPRLPPGQYDVGSDWPVLTAEPTPRISPETWSITVAGQVERPTTWDWDQVHQLPASEYRGDIHCVTTWSKFDTRFGGVSLDALWEVARPTAEGRFVMATSKSGYTTNLPIEDLTGGKAWLVWEFDGQPLSVEHGGPVRLLVPHLYFWKSAKWVSGIVMQADDEPGFWENAGYNLHGDPWKEERYW